MFLFIAALVLILIAIGVLVFARTATKSSNSLRAEAAALAEERGYGSNRKKELTTEADSAAWASRWAKIVGVVLIVLAAIALVASSVYTQGVGEAKVITNLDGTIAGEKLDPGFGIKAPWQETVDFDIFQQEVLYAGQKGEAPSYSGGEVNGAEVTASVKRGAQAYIDISVVYSVNPDQVTEIYKEYRSQERFTRQQIIPSILAGLRDVPSAYTPVEFRGEKRGEATDKLLDAMNAKLERFGVEVSNVNLQDIRYTEQVEDSIKAVEVAQQKEETAQAELRATEVSAQAQIIEATAAADANRILSASLTPEILQSRYLEALKKGTVYVVPEGSTPLVQTK